MRILHLISSGGMYGAEAVILNLARALPAAGPHACFLGVFAPSGRATPALHRAALEAGVASSLVPCRGQVDVSAGKAIRSLSERVGADVVHAHGYKADLYAFSALRGTLRPALVSTCHTWYDNDLAVRLYGAADRWVLRHFDQVVAVSTEVAHRLTQAGVAPGRVHLVRNGISTMPELERVASRQTAGPLRVGLVGRLAPEKGVDLFLRAAAVMAGRLPAIQFVVAGDGPDRASLEALLTELGLKGRAELLGQQTDMSAFYASLDVLVSASRQEGLPMALLEGMARGLPVVATTVGEVPQVVVPQETGILVAPESPEALASAVERLVSDAALRERFGRAGKKRVAEEFSAERMTADYLDVYGAALLRHSPRTMAAGASNPA